MRKTLTIVAVALTLLISVSLPMLWMLGVITVDNLASSLVVEILGAGFTATFVYLLTERVAKSLGDVSVSDVVTELQALRGEVTALQTTIEQMRGEEVEDED